MFGVCVCLVQMCECVRAGDLQLSVVSQDPLTLELPDTELRAKRAAPPHLHALSDRVISAFSGMDPR